ncbi:hypothetical protein BMS3Abin10_02097 [bacterium BMS3Abin10]|nr:hypothetical protein BMS3Abin10_02097 [bacterium BMS3Abin10]GBE37969.1 hypothetical protein BMS3Bbin08_00568 [bacterium BMS3Bbin08]
MALRQAQNYYLQLIIFKDLFGFRVELWYRADRCRRYYTMLRPCSGPEYYMRKINCPSCKESFPYRNFFLRLFRQMVCDNCHAKIYITKKSSVIAALILTFYVILAFNFIVGQIKCNRTNEKIMYHLLVTISPLVYFGR